MEMLPFAALAFLLIVVIPIGALILAFRGWDRARSLEHFDRDHVPCPSP